MKKGNANPDLTKLERNITGSLRMLFMTNRIGHYWRSSSATISKPIPSDPVPPVFETSSDVSLDVGVEVTPVNVTATYATYRVRVSLQAQGGTVSDVDLGVEGDGLSDSTHYSLITPSDGVVTWETKESSKIYGSGDVTVSGTVKVTYSVSHATPTSVSAEDYPATSGGSRTVTKDYSETIHLGTRIDPDKVTFKVIPSKSEVPPDSDVKFTVEIINKNKKYIDSDYTLDVVYPFENDVETITFSNSVFVNGDSSWVATAGTVHYASTGTFHYSGVLKFDGFSKRVEGDIVVSRYANESDPSPLSGSLRILNVTPPEPKYPKEGDTVKFEVVVENTYSVEKNITVALSFDTGWFSSLSSFIGSYSTKTFIFYWRPQESRLYKWFVGIWENMTIENYTNGTILVDPPGGIEVTGWLNPNVSTTVTVGTKAHFDVYVKSLVDKFTYDFPVIVEYSYVDPAGKAHEPITVIHSYVSQLAPKEEKNVTWFDFRFDNPGKYMFTLYVNGTPVDDKTITVKPEGNVVAWMECKKSLVAIGSLDQCIVYFNLTHPTTMKIRLEEIDFGGKKVWPNEPSGVSVDISTVTLSPSNMMDHMTITIGINSSLANYYFGKPIYRTYLDRFAGYSYVVTAKFQGLSYQVSDIIQIMYSDPRTGSDKTIDDISLVGNIAGIVDVAVEGTNPIGWIILGASNIPNVAKFISDIQWLFGDRYPQENDNNMIIGG